MCGIVGMVGNITTAEKTMFKNLLVMNAVRGFDGCGVAYENKKGEASYIKHVIPAATFVRDTKEVSLDTRMIGSDFLIGHNRAATKGVVNAVNSHPFKHDHITGVHNGTLTDQTLLIDHDKYEVDSDNVFADIAANGIAHTWEHIDGAAALVWHDETDNTVNLIRNIRRPLWLAHDWNKSAYFFASEPLMLLNAAVRNDVAISIPKKVPVNKHIKISCTRTYNQEEKCSQVSVVETGLVPFTLTRTTSQYSARSYGRGISVSSTHSTTKNNTSQLQRTNSQTQSTKSGTNSVTTTGRNQQHTGVVHLQPEVGKVTGSIESLVLHPEVLKNIYNPNNQQTPLYVYAKHKVATVGTLGVSTDYVTLLCRAVSPVTYKTIPRVVKIEGHHSFLDVGDFILVEDMSYVSNSSREHINIPTIGNEAYYEVGALSVEFKCNISDLSPSIYNMGDADYLSLKDYLEVVGNTCSECGKFVKFYDDNNAFHLVDEGMLVCANCTDKYYNRS